MHFKLCSLLILAVGMLIPSIAIAQIDQRISNEVRDSIVVRFNRSDFKGIYQLADTSFTKDIAETRLVTFLRGNRNSGNIKKIVSQEETRGGISYRLAFEVRDMNMFLKVTPEGKFTGFGFSTAPTILLAQSPAVKSTNPLKTSFDRSVDSLVRAYFRDPNTAGISIGLIKEGEPHIYHYGQTHKGKDALPNSQTEYEIASITKTFTATLLAQAVIDGKVSLEDDIRPYLPGEYPNLTFDNHAITLRDLANHTSRLPNLPLNVNDLPGSNPLAPEASMDSATFYKALHEVKLDTVPGYKFEYSNWGIALLGHVLEKVYKQTYAQLLRRYITGPLKMGVTHYHLSKENESRRALPYSENGNPIIFQKEGFFGPAGDIHADMHDMIKYLKAQIDETNPAIKLTHQPTRNNTGLGWGTRIRAQVRDIQHNGSSPGFRSHISAFPDLNSGCVILANSKADMGKLILDLQSMLSNKTW
jgi:CubicO group peptidase (beta-lactamase class C family)